MVVWVLYLIGNVLVAVDGSENSERALDFALDFAEKYAAALTSLMLVNPQRLPLTPVMAWFRWRVICADFTKIF